MMLRSKTMDIIYVGLIWLILLQVLHLLPFIFADRNLCCINKICGEASTKIWSNIESFLKSVMIVYKKHAYQFAHDYLGPPNWIVCPFELIVVNKLWECNNPLNLCQKRKRKKNVTIHSLLDTCFYFFYCSFVFFSRVHSKPWNNIRLFPCRLSFHLNSMGPSSPWDLV